MAYKNYLLGLLTVISLFNYVDRQALSILLQDIKIEFALSDSQLGLLSGIAFALFYSVMGIPIARWADRGNRVTIISVTAALWSAAVALCGAVGSFVQLLLVRIAVAVGEAGCIPPAFSLIADYFARADRPRASAIYGLGGSLSVLIGVFAAGWLNEFYGWRMTFVILGAPGLVLAALAWFTLGEPRSEKPRQFVPIAPLNRPDHVVAPSPVAEPTLKEVVVTLSRNATFRNLLLCMVVMYFFNYGIAQWVPTFFIRSFGLSTGELGTWFALIGGGAGIAGLYLGGELASRYAPNNEALQLKGIAIAIAVSSVPMFFTYLSPDKYWALGLLGTCSIALAASNGPLFSTIQTLVPERMRAVAFALLYLFANLIGMGLGPLAAGMLSDALRPWAGEESLRYALLSFTPILFWVAWYAWRASRVVERDLTGIAVDHSRGIAP